MKITTQGALTIAAVAAAVLVMTMSTSSALPAGSGFRYKGDTEVYVGVIAQQVARLMPGTVVRGDDGYLRVDYDRWA
jgi:hypothetical protein